MRAMLAVLIIASIGRTQVLEAQLDYTARLGVTWATPLVRDEIFEEIEVQQKLAPTLAFGASLPFSPGYQAGLEATLTRSGYEASETSASTDLGTVTTGSITLGLHGAVSGDLYWRAGVGLLGYFPSDESGIFLQGGTTRFLAGAGIDYRRPAFSNLDLMASLRYDFHRFTTDQLESRGFSQSQGVQRISASVGIARGSR